MVATAMVVVPALIASEIEATEIEVRLSANTKMKNFETSFWKPVKRKNKDTACKYTYM